MCVHIGLHIMEWCHAWCKGHLAIINYACKRFWTRCVCRIPLLAHVKEDLIGFHKSWVFFLFVFVKSCPWGWQVGPVLGEVIEKFQISLQLWTWIQNIICEDSFQTCSVKSVRDLQCFLKFRSTCISAACKNLKSQAPLPPTHRQTYAYTHSFKFEFIINTQ